MSKKLIDNIDEETWRVFSAYCKAKNTLIGKELTTLLKKEYKVSFEKRGV
jgi:hypothetical protein